MSVGLVAGTAACVLLGLIVLSGLLGRPATAEVRGDEVVIRPRGVNRLWAGRSRLSVPLASVVDVQLGVPRRLVPMGWRVGTHLPGVLTAGTFRSTGVKSFWLVARAKRVTVIDFERAKFDRAVLELDAAGEAALSELAPALPPGIRRVHR